MNVKYFLVIIFLINITIAFIPKKSKRRYIKHTKQIRPTIPAGIYIDKLVTYDVKKERFVDILNNNGKVTKRYSGGIWIEHINRDGTVRYRPIHKLPQN
jgi:hypothetical protein